MLETFEQIARVYDPMNRILTFGQWDGWQRAFDRFTPVAPGMRILDVGCGTGDLTLRLARRVGPEGHVAGVDLSPAMLAVAEEKLQRAGMRARAELMVGNALHLPFPDGTFDGATAGFVLRNVADLDGAMREILRVLRPGGFFVSLDVSKPDSRVVRALYLFFFYRIVPLLGLLARRGRGPYDWLAESLKTFPDRPALARRLRAAGFADVVDRPLGLGSAALHRGVRPG